MTGKVWIFLRFRSGGPARTLGLAFGVFGSGFCVGSSGANNVTHNVLSLAWILAVDAPLKKTFEVWIYAPFLFNLHIEPSLYLKNLDSSVKHGHFVLYLVCISIWIRRNLFSDQLNSLND